MDMTWVKKLSFQILATSHLTWQNHSEQNPTIITVGFIADKQMEQIQFQMDYFINHGNTARVTEIYEKKDVMSAKEGE